MKYILGLAGIVSVVFLQLAMMPKEYKPEDIVLVQSVIMWNDKCSQHEKQYDRYISCEDLKHIISEHKEAYASHFKSH